MTRRAATLPDNRLSFTDQAMFLWVRAAGEEPVMQVAWIYEHPFNFDNLTKFYDTAARTSIGRLRIERSPLPFGRHRWVLADDAGVQIEVEGTARPRSDVSDWLDERVQLPIDPEYGPGWRLGVLKLTDGSTAVSVVISHSLADGLGGLSAVVESLQGHARNFGHPPPHSRTRLRAVATDLRETLRGAPEVGRALRAGAKMAFKRRHEISRSRKSRPEPKRAVSADRHVVVPTALLFVDLDQWDRHAEELGGNSYSLLAGFAAKLAEHLGRRRAEDGAVTLLVPISERTEENTDATAASLANIRVDPTKITTDLSDVRRAIRQGLDKERDAPNEALQLLPLIPFIPKRVVRRGGDLIFGFAADLPVSVSILGDLDPVLGRLDGTDAEYVVMRGVDRHVSEAALEQRRGQLTLVAGRLVGKMCISIIAYQCGAENSKARLRELVAQTLTEFGMTGNVE